MPRRVRRNRRKAPRRAKRASPARSLRNPMGGLPGQNHAVIRETSNRATVIANNAYINTIQIQNFPRAMSLLSSFRFYRLAKVEFQYIPTWNTFQEATGSATVPEFVMAMNRVGDSYASGYNQLCQQGAKPVKFLKTINISYKPNLVQSLQTSQNSVSTGAIYNMGIRPVYDKWINTQNQMTLVKPDPNPDNQQFLTVLNYPTYYGHDFFIQQDSTITADLPVAHCTVTCFWEFKDAIWDTQDTVAKNDLNLNNLTATEI